MIIYVFFFSLYSSDFFFMYFCFFVVMCLMAYVYLLCELYPLSLKILKFISFKNMFKQKTYSNVNSNIHNRQKVETTEKSMN